MNAARVAQLRELETHTAANLAAVRAALAAEQQPTLQAVPSVLATAVELHGLDGCEPIVAALVSELQRDGGRRLAARADEQARQEAARRAAFRVLRGGLSDSPH
ncbi:hypothetical protein [Actinomadura macrotermitis]|uniref:Uncharacterized protein n=1 Tax=Actinomadura macrotermitis TaxID=2585200 RepID=A0A7K0BSJ0_9ACTN|nr:hypothetical protein [Actinomadura macrotermitis]MQY04150.1 hypothetical protein [Actinomadura macrotermitis]